MLLFHDVLPPDQPVRPLARIIATATASRITTITARS